jgi:hypothetical protein
MSRCANPTCTKPNFNDLRQRWVQVEEVRLVGSQLGEGPVQRLFAAVTCSKQCAADVLVAAELAEESGRADVEAHINAMFPGITDEEERAATEAHVDAMFTDEEPR